MDDLDNEILERIKSLEIDCPDCEGGDGKINVFQWIKDHSNIINK